jgi:hypothetical protein
MTPIALMKEEKHLVVPIVGAGRPAMVKDDRLALAPIFVENFDAIFGGDHAHGIPRLAGLMGECFGGLIAGIGLRRYAKERGDADRDVGQLPRRNVGELRLLTGLLMSCTNSLAQFPSEQACDTSRRGGRR